MILSLAAAMMARPALGADGTAAPSEAFVRALDLSPLQHLSVQHRQTIKTLDSFARQALTTITGRSRVDGRPAVFTLLDMAARPDAYSTRNLIKIKHVPLRQDLRLLDYVPEAERERIVREGTISLAFYNDARVQQLLQNVEASAMHKASAVQQLHGAAGTLRALVENPLGFPPVAMIPPAPAGAPDSTVWHELTELAGNIPPLVEQFRQNNRKPPDPLPGYDDEKIGRTLQAAINLAGAWREGKVDEVNRQAKALADQVAAINPTVYPSEARRHIEVVYNRLFQLTIPGAALYFIAFVCFLMSAHAQVPRLRTVGLLAFVAGFLVHTIGIAIRWWLVAAQHGNWFDGIPIKNQFESVLMSAWFGSTVGLALELGWHRKSVFGAAASFVGWMSLVAIFSAPMVSGRDIGGEIGQVAGVLMSYWLYIHVTAVVAAYALISMSFLLSLWWFMSSRAAPGFRATLDACNLVVLQLAFWILGTGIILGAVWADQSWGRPWGWDPKETFALVTWIVYLVVVHVRVAAINKAWWTSLLSVAGFFVMLFNWIGVNFFLVGLHSYA